MSKESPASILFDQAGNPVEVVNLGGKYYVGNSMLQNVIISTKNSDSGPLAQLNPGASFTGDSEESLGVAGIQINAIADQPIRICCEQSMDGANWFLHDEWARPVSAGTGRTVQATASYFRVIITNLGPATTTSFECQTAMCPTVEALPRSLTPRGRLALSSQSDSFTPDPKNFLPYTQVGRALLIDAERNLATRGPVLTDENSFRDDFTQGGTTVSPTGNCYFVNGETHVIGSGTSFLSEVKKGQYLRLGIDTEDLVVAVADVYSDIDLELAEAYAGSTAVGPGALSDWKYSTGVGGSITVAASLLNVISGMTNGSLVQALHAGDYLPIILTFQAAVTQRILNQELIVGFMDGDPGAVDKQAVLVFSGTDRAKVILRTSFDSTDIEETEVTLPYGATTDDTQVYRIDIQGHLVVLFINQVRMAVHQNHIPGPYDAMDMRVATKNTGVPASSTTLSVDSLRYLNYDRVEVGVVTAGEPLNTQLMRATISTSDNIVAAAADTELLAGNPQRLGGTVFNDSTAILYLKLDTGASPTSFTVRMLQNDYYEIPYSYAGAVHGYWASATGAARVTELT